jgi:hypothetical protein
MGNLQVVMHHAPVIAVIETVAIKETDLLVFQLAVVGSSSS